MAILANVERNDLLVGAVVSLEVEHQQLVDVLSGRGVAAGVGHRAPAVAKIVPHHQGNLPKTCSNKINLIRYLWLILKDFRRHRYDTISIIITIQER